MKTLNGVYPRMNEVYTKLGEMINAMRNLCDLLELGKNLFHLPLTCSESDQGNVGMRINSAVFFEGCLCLYIERG